MQALVVWTKEGKTGIEPQCNVPENARFAGAVTPVRFSGDKRWYPAKVIMLSASTTALEDKCKEVAEQLLKETKETKAKHVKRKRKMGTGEGKASDQDVARALGSKVPVVPHLQEAKGATDKAKKVAKLHHLQGQEKTDRSILALGNKNPSQKSKPEARERDNDPGKQDCLEWTDNEQDDQNDSNDDSKDGSGVEEEEETAIEKWCQCNSCQVLQKYDNPMYLNFLTDLTKLYSTKSSKCKKFLVLQAILPGCKQAELVPGSGVHIKSADKDEIRVDFKNKPSSIIRETLYALYGKEQFRVLPVTARGIKPGSYGIQDNVLKALVDFVNKNVESKKAVTFKSLVITINKRAPEWRRGEQSPRSPCKKKKVRATSPSMKVICTSPFKCTPLKSPKGTPLKSPGLSPRRTPVNSASKRSPLKDPATLSPASKRRLFALDCPEPAAGKAAATPATPAPSSTPVPSPASEPYAAAPRWPGWNYHSTAYGPQQGYGPQGYGPQAYGGYGPQGYGPSGPPPFNYNWNEQQQSSNNIIDL